MSEPVLVVFLHRGTWADRYQAVTIALTAAALGEAVTVALSFEPLRQWAEGRFDEGAPATGAAAGIGSLREALDEARRELGVRVVACEAAIRLAGLDPEAIRGGLDAIEALPSLWRRAQAGRAVSI